MLRPSLTGYDIGMGHRAWSIEEKA
jgi:putative endonuclease